MFVEGYLNATGKETTRTLQMIKDAGFSIQTNGDISEQRHTEQEGVLLKELELLRPRMKCDA